MRIPTLEALEAIRGDRPAIRKVWMLKRLLRRDAFGRIVFKKPGEQIESVSARGADAGCCRVAAVLQTVLVPYVKAGWAGEMVT